MGDSNVAACTKAVTDILDLRSSRFLDTGQVRKKFVSRRDGSCFVANTCLGTEGELLLMPAG
jgi:hypothetical protein